MSNPEQIFRVIGDGLSIASLSMIASMAQTAWKRIPKDVTVPMQWNRQGQPTWRAKKSVALLFPPIMATVLLLVPTLIGATHGQTDLQAIVVVFAVRSITAAAFVFIFMHFLRQVYQTLEDEGSLSG